MSESTHILKTILTHSFTYISRIESESCLLVSNLVSRTILILNCRR